MFRYWFSWEIAKNAATGRWRWISILCRGRPWSDACARGRWTPIVDENATQFCIHLATTASKISSGKITTEISANFFFPKEICQLLLRNLQQSLSSHYLFSCIPSQFSLPLISIFLLIRSIHLVLGLPLGLSSYFCICVNWLSNWSRGQHVWLLIMRSRVRSLALPQF